MIKKRNIWLILYIAFTCFIFSRSLKTAPESTDESSFLVGQMMSFLEPFVSVTGDALHTFATVIVRKAAHVAEYFVQTCILCGYFSGFARKIKGNLSTIMLAGVLTALFDEGIQLFSEGRAGLISDVFIDFGGTLLGIAASVVLVHFIKAAKKKI